MNGSGDSEFPSKNQIEKAGKYLRNLQMGRLSDADPERLERSIQIVTTFREAHGYPMTKVRLGLESMAKTLKLSDPVISQRHKRVPRIIRKLTRMPGTNLARLEDIGGCRIVVQGPADMDAICKRIRKNWTPQFSRDPRDYIANPKDMGYRARHFVVVRDDRAIEIQVRTVGQQQWADAVEALDARRHELNLKDSEGPDELLEYFRLAGELIHRREYKLGLRDGLMDEFSRARQQVIAAGYYRS